MTGSKKRNPEACRAATEDVPDKTLAKEIRAANLTSLKCNFCKRCGNSMSIKVPDGEDELRHVCSSCGFIDYHNPRMVVGCLVEHDGKVLMCRRALEPCSGLWTLPAGYMELSETTAGASLKYWNAFNESADADGLWETPPEGAARETMEEANASVDIVAPYAHLDIPVIGQAYIFFRAHLAEPFSFSSGPESQEVALFSPDDIPFDSIAFSSVYITLKRWVDDKDRGIYSLHHGVIRKRPGASMRDQNAFQFVDSYQIDLPAPVIKT